MFPVSAFTRGIDFILGVLVTCARKDGPDESFLTTFTTRRHEATMADAFQAKEEIGGYSAALGRLDVARPNCSCVHRFLRWHAAEPQPLGSFSAKWRDHLHRVGFTGVAQWPRRLLADSSVYAVSLHGRLRRPGGLRSGDRMVYHIPERRHQPSTERRGHSRLSGRSELDGHLPRPVLCHGKH